MKELDIENVTKVRGNKNTKVKESKDNNGFPPIWKVLAIVVGIMLFLLLVKTGNCNNLEDQKDNKDVPTTTRLFRDR